MIIFSHVEGPFAQYRTHTTMCNSIHVGHEYNVGAHSFETLIFQGRVILKYYEIRKGNSISGTTINPAPSPQPK